MKPQPVVQLTHKGRQFTFWHTGDGPLAFWRVESSAGAIYVSPVRVVGDEQPDFFRALADTAVREGL
jgi:hypothetical protein